MTYQILLDQLREAYPSYSDQQLCLLLIDVAGEKKVRLRVYKDRRSIDKYCFIFGMVHATHVDKVSEYKAIKRLQQQADAMGRNSQYVRDMWRRFKKSNPGEIDEIAALCEGLAETLDKPLF